jgi:hypothetical protein
MVAPIQEAKHCPAARSIDRNAFTQGMIWLVSWLKIHRR